eukprot:XP_011418958.1 PREDICTED: uncharacterized protein LOC105322117 [Crassostrea gigas]
MKCQVIHGRDTSVEFEIKTGVRQGCLLSHFLFLLAIDWIMRETTAGKRNGIQWNLMNQLEDLDFAEDLALLSHTYDQMQEKTSILINNASKTGLRINKEKTKLMRINTNNINSIEIDNTQLENVTSFTYPGSVANHSGGTEEDVKSRLAKAYTAFGMLRKVWKSKSITIKTKLRIFNSNVKSVLLYGSET